MNHQPFEHWLLSEESLSEENERALRDHLHNCDQCRAIENAWIEVANLFVEIPQMSPAPGFVNRWQASLESNQAAEKIIRQRWQSLIFLIAIANGAALALLFLGFQLFNTYGSITDWVLSWVYRAASVMVVANGFRHAFATLTRTIPQLVPMNWWIGIALALSISTVIWIVSMMKLSSLPRRT
jgi:hypothetical protein